jgi:hypothetical protein
MKKILNFLQWQWQRFETWQKCWMLAAFLMGASVSASEPYKIYLLGAGGAIILGFWLKWAIWDGTRNAWASYNEEQEKIVNIMKDGIK